MYIVLAKAHLREALVLHEECQRLHRMCRELKGKHALTAVLKNAHKTAMQVYSPLDKEDDFTEMLDAPLVQGYYLITLIFTFNISK